MRKLRRLPWRIPKSHNGAEKTPPERGARESHKRPASAPEPLEREVPTQPVAFTAGRYVYGYTASPTCHTEIRRKGRHRVASLTPLPIAP
jgi:hypothetical protein